MAACCITGWLPNAALLHAAHARIQTGHDADKHARRGCSPKLTCSIGLRSQCGKPVLLPSGRSLLQGGFCKGLQGQQLHQNPCAGSNSQRRVSRPASCSSAVDTKLVEQVKEIGGIDVAILSNGPGEVTTWLKPVVRALRALFGTDTQALRISVILAPCPHASGRELDVVQSYPEVDRCQGPEHFTWLQLTGRTKLGWDWRRKGVCIFLGGDQFNALVVGQWLGYSTLVYAEDAVRWAGYADKYALRTPALLDAVPNWARPYCKVVGDLFADAVSPTPAGPRGGASADEPAGRRQLSPDAGDSKRPVIGLLPGSKGVKLMVGVPFVMSVADELRKRIGSDVRFVLPLAPTVDLATLQQYADPPDTSAAARLGWASGSLHLAGSEPFREPAAAGLPMAQLATVAASPGEGMAGVVTEGRAVSGGVESATHARPHYVADPGSDDGDACAAVLVTSGGTRIEVWQQSPAYELLQQCTLCITTIGTNTAELGFLGVPMIVIVPTHLIEVFKGATGGVLGLLTNAPGWLGATVTRAVNAAALQSAGNMAWPNRWAGKVVVPELVGRIEPPEVAEAAEQLLSSPGRLEEMRQRLQNLNGRSGPRGRTPGASSLIALEVVKLLELEPEHAVTQE